MARATVATKLVFPQFDGSSNATLFFDAVRDHAYIGQGYSPAAIEGTLPIEADQNITDDQVTANKREYAILYHDISRSLTGFAICTKKQVDISLPQ